jgi:hypothetical protein
MKPVINLQNAINALKAMSYPERKPIYEAYEAIVKKIIEERKYKIYAESSINELDASLLDGFKAIRNKLLIGVTRLPED